MVSLPAMQLGGGEWHNIHRKVNPALEDHILMPAGSGTPQ